MRLMRDPSGGMRDGDALEDCSSGSCQMPGSAGARGLACRRGGTWCSWGHSWGRCGGRGEVFIIPLHHFASYLSLPPPKMVKNVFLGIRLLRGGGLWLTLPLGKQLYRKVPCSMFMLLLKNI